MRLCCVQRVGMLKRCLQRQIFTEVFLHDIFMCASGCISHSQRRETERNADLYIPDEMITTVTFWPQRLNCLLYFIDLKDSMLYFL